MNNKETPQEYAQRRANKTGKPYLVTTLGHAMMDCRANRRACEVMECLVASVFKPEKTK